jgi:hypothetical protein
MTTVNVISRFRIRRSDGKLEANDADGRTIDHDLDYGGGL